MFRPDCSGQYFSPAHRWKLNIELTQQFKKIILSRPAVEAGENLGFLPGDMKDKMNSERKVSMANYEKQLDSLELQNSRLRNDMRMFNSESKAKWESFKKNFNKELDSLRKSISLLVERNVKKGS